MHAVKRFQDTADKAAKEAEDASVGSGSTLATGRRYRRPKSRGWSPEGRSPVGSPQGGNGGMGMGLGMLVGVAHEVEIGAAKEKEEEWAEEVPTGATSSTSTEPHALSCEPRAPRAPRPAPRASRPEPRAPSVPVLTTPHFFDEPYHPHHHAPGGAARAREGARGVDQVR